MVTALLLALNWSGTLPVLWLQAQLWIPIVLVTRSTRSLSWSSMAAAFVLGASASATLAATFSLALSADVDSPFTRSLIVPLLEETCKALPLFLLFSRPQSRLRTAPCLTDGLLLGLALGAGFSFTEDLARGWDWSRLAGLRYGPSLGGWFLFPGADLQEAANRTPVIVFAGHAMLTAWIGLSLSVVARRARAGARRMSWIIPFAVFALAVANHGFFNATSTGELDLLGRLSQWVVTMRGHFLVWAFFPAVVAAVWRDRRALKHQPSASHLPLRTRRWLAYRAASSAAAAPVIR